MNSIQISLIIFLCICAGDVWAANNWNNLNAVASPDPYRPTSTWGGGSGFTVIYGVAAPVKPPLIGQVQTP
ncbi:MAG TPA: hypothetical protein VMG59_04620 [Phycisphaerae bacterium]|nr:hypothetical protein [Phycisphaerae bacterium]